MKEELNQMTNRLVVWQLANRDDRARKHHDSPERRITSHSEVVGIVESDTTKPITWNPGPGFQVISLVIQTPLFVVLLKDQCIAMNGCSLTMVGQMNWSQLLKP